MKLIWRRDQAGGLELSAEVEVLAGRVLRTAEGWRAAAPIDDVWEPIGIFPTEAEAKAAIESAVLEELGA